MGGTMFHCGLTLVLACCGLACAAASPPPPAIAPRIDARPLVWVVDGAGDLRGCSTSLAKTMQTEGNPVELAPFAWSHGYRRILIDQIDIKHAREQGAKFAEVIAARTAQEPTRRMVIVAHSAGCAVALAALEALPANSIDRLLLLAPSVSRTYDLRPAARSSREGIDVFCSTKDIWALGVGMKIVGTTDARRTVAAAGRVGFQPKTADDLVRERVRQHEWTKDLASTGHTGGHYGAYAPGFARIYLLPLMLGDGGR